MQQQHGPAAAKNVQASPAERSRRLSQAADWLLEGMRPRATVVKGCEAWGVQKRMAQIYVATARRQLQVDAQQKNLTLEVQLIQHQRCQAMRALNAVLLDPNAAVAAQRAVASCVGQLRNLLNDFEKTALRAAERTVDQSAGDDHVQMGMLLGKLKHLEENAAANEGKASAVPVPEQASSQQTLAVPTEKPKTDGKAHVPPEFAQELLEPSTFPMLDSPISQSQAPAQRGLAVSVSASACSIMPSGTEAKAHCASTQKSGSVASTKKTPGK